ncbi:MAG: hypothetical protein RLZZ543_375 [Bacteroidota bacterium]
MTELQEKIESFKNFIVYIATTFCRSEEEENYKQLRTFLIGNDEIKDHLPDFVKTNRSVAQFWQFIKTKFTSYSERRTFIWSEFTSVLDYIETKQNGNIDKTKSSGQTESMKEKLIRILENQRQIGEDFLIKIDRVSNLNELDLFLIEYDDWNDFNIFIFDKAYVQRQYFQIYSGAANYSGNVNVDKDSFQGKRDRVLYCLPRQLGHLRAAISQTNILRNTDLLPIDDKLTISNQQLKKTQIMSKLFISHSSKDDSVIKPFIDLIESIGVPHDKIFYSSHPAYGVGLGENIFERLKAELEDDVFALFMLSENFYQSPVCLCEMGAVWIKSNKQIPILIPPFDFSGVQGVFPNSLGFKMNDKNQLNNFKGELELHFNLNPTHISRWEEKRDEYIVKINGLLK